MRIFLIGLYFAIHIWHIISVPLFATIKFIFRLVPCIIPKFLKKVRVRDSNEIITATGLKTKYISYILFLLMFRVSYSEIKRYYRTVCGPKKTLILYAHGKTVRKIEIDFDADLVIHEGTPNIASTIVFDRIDLKYPENLSIDLDELEKMLK
jgi:hypothetical protein